MGNRLISVYNKLTKETKTAFISTFIIGMLVHLYKFTNYLPNHDTMYNFYSDQNVLGSGRWFLSIACGFSSFFDLPWINGLFSVFFISITSTVVIKLFNVSNPVVVILSSALFVTFPSITETFFFEFTADGYMLAMLLSALSIYVLKIGHNKIRYIALSALLLCLSCGIYQAYVSYALALALTYLIWNIFTENYDIKTLLKWARNLIIAVLFALGSYYFIWKLCMLIQNVQPNDYQGISELGNVGLNTIIPSLKNSISALVSFFVEWNVFEHGINLYGVLNLIFLCLFCFIIIYSIIRTKVYNKKSAFSLILISLICIPFAITIWCFTSTSVSYAPRMLQSIAVVYFLAIILFDRYCQENISNMFAVFMSIMIINFSISANIAYYYLNIEYEKTYCEAIEIKNMLDTEFEKLNGDACIAIIGNRNAEVSLDRTSQAGHIQLFADGIEKSLLFNSEHITGYLKNVLYYDKTFVLDSETINQITETDEFKNMSNWPAKDSIKTIDGTVVLKLSE